MKTVALIVRGKRSLNHSPDLLAQHADVVLSTGEPIGFFGTGGSSPSTGVGMNGVVYGYAQLKSQRPHYVDARLAASVLVYSTICTVSVTDSQARAFDKYWRTLDYRSRRGKENFTLLGDNCSTHANEAFVAANILKREIPGLDTPDRLLEQLRSRHGSSFSCQSGFVGFTPDGVGFRTEVIIP